MILSDITIRDMIKTQALVVFPNKPYDDFKELYEKAIQPASFDLTLGSGFKYPKKSDSHNMFNAPVEYDNIEADTYVLRPHTFVLATSEEYINLPNDLSAFVEGRSSIGRMGLFIQNAGWVDPGFRGTITYELYNASDTPIYLSAGTRIAQLVFAQLDRHCAKPYSGKYQGQVGTTESRINLD